MGIGVGLFDRDGKELDSNEYIALTMDPEYRVVKQDRVGECFVSTVWLGLNHQYAPLGQPIIFETMVFVDGRGDLDCERYETEEQARQGHVKMIYRWAKR